ncbi:sterol desaturase family protein [Halieaceae bacterium]|jgi:sterol desaturase/sphingolipid hydroxylase (fatty acid hydroxylase superfamily)|nr:sterol desaturase family protein [Halieaceae bacterium]
MSLDWIAQYSWQAALVYIVTVIFLARLSHYLAFKVPALERMRQWNIEEDQPKRANPKYAPVVKANARVGLGITLLIVLLVAPLATTLESLPVWRYVADIAVILLVYDFIYYLTHRFAFHGWPLKQVHGLHHQARDISRYDSSYVHPLETFIGLAIYVVSVIATALIMGEVHAVSAAIAYVVWSQVNTIVHTKFDLDYFPFKTINYLTSKHAVHHQNMNMGNYSSVLLLFDWMFGTLD